MPTTFFETVPLDELMDKEKFELGDKGSVTPNRETSGVVTGRSRTVLVVDDEYIIADTLVAILDASGFSATAAYSGESALELIAAKAPDLLITDVSMPGMNGVELAISVREHFPNCAVLLFSGHASTTGLVEEARQRGYSFQLLDKPIHPRDLLDRLRSVA
jgi:DNA-binding NtrC family response regulator